MELQPAWRLTLHSGVWVGGGLFKELHDESIHNAFPYVGRQLLNYARQHQSVPLNHRKTPPTFLCMAKEGNYFLSFQVWDKVGKCAFTEGCGNQLSHLSRRTRGQNPRLVSLHVMFTGKPADWAPERDISYRIRRSSFHKGNDLLPVEVYGVNMLQCKSENEKKIIIRLCASCLLSVSRWHHFCDEILTMAYLLGLHAKLA